MATYRLLTFPQVRRALRRCRRRCWWRIRTACTPVRRPGSFPWSGRTTRRSRCRTWTRERVRWTPAASAWWPPSTPGRATACSSAPPARRLPKHSMRYAASPRGPSTISLRVPRRRWPPAAVIRRRSRWRPAPGWTSRWARRWCRTRRWICATTTRVTPTRSRSVPTGPGQRLPGTCARCAWPRPRGSVRPRRGSSTPIWPCWMIRPSSTGSTPRSRPGWPHRRRGASGWTSWRRRSRRWPTHISGNEPRTSEASATGS